MHQIQFREVHIKKVLFIGESWHVHTIEAKGFDTFSFDRREESHGISAMSVLPEHPILEDVPEECPSLLGYNYLIPKAGSEVVARIGNDPLIVIGSYGKGKTRAIVTDCAPHWALVSFCTWEGYAVLWRNILNLLTA